jgi:5-methylcytosine-specific restriction endonuclease McrA
MLKVAECGTRSGYNRHRRNNEQPCRDCTTANTQSSKDFQKKNPEAAKKHRQVTYNNNKESILESHRSYYRNNKEKILKRHKRYYVSNIDLYRRAKSRRRAKERNNGYEKYTLAQVLELYGTVCHICLEQIDMDAPRSIGAKGWENGLHLDHVIPISKGGSDTLSNIRPSHGICNMTKSSK